MAAIDDILADVERLIRTVQPRAAEEKIRALLASVDVDELRVWEPDLRQTISHFHKKRRKLLTDELERVLGIIPPALTLKSSASSHPDAGQIVGAALIQDLAAELDTLSEYYVFKWGSHYRDRLTPFYQDFIELMTNTPSMRDELASEVQHQFERHSAEIFGKGFVYTTSQKHAPLETAILKSLNGLQRFLDLPLEFYASQADAALSVAHAKALRCLTSGMLTGVLQGYGNTTFRPTSGFELLTTRPRPWAHTLPFLTAPHFDVFVASLAEGTLREGIQTSVAPLIRAIDEVATSVPDALSLPALAQFLSDPGRLEMALQPPAYAPNPHLIELHAYLDTASVHPSTLHDAARRGVALILMPARSDLMRVIEDDTRLLRIVVPLYEGTPQSRVNDALKEALQVRRSPRAGSQPFEYNFARDFPLQNPFLTRYAHVPRSSVRELLRTFDARNGVRLWCSVRRSGKTTACRDLSSSTGNAAVVVQTCDKTGQIPGGSAFYDAAVAALRSAEPIADTFFLDQVLVAIGEPTESAPRCVFILDEYETLFGRLRSALRRDPELRYDVVQPLLNQMVAFTEENLLVFLGQQPNAHYILMDQNQLSAYVEQDSFPLFRHDSGAVSGEFAELVRKVLTHRVTFDGKFLNAVHAATAGHPFMTVNYLVELVDWLIERKRPLNELALDEDDIRAFERAKVTKTRLSTSPEYAFFREAIAEALSSDGRDQNPWLFAIYATLKQIGRSSPETLECSRQDFTGMVGELTGEEFPWDADSLLTMGAQANFFTFDDHVVRAKIPLLARIAANTRPRVAA